MANDPSQAYDLSLFEKREAKVIPLKVDQQKTRKRQSRHRLQKVINMAVTSIVTIGIVAVIAASIVLEVQLTEINNRISVEQAQTNHLISETERLKGEQAAHTSAQSVEQYAKENGLQKTDPDQNLYVSVDTEDNIEVAPEQQQGLLEEIWAGIIRFFS